MSETQSATPAPGLPAWLPADGQQLVREEAHWRMPGRAGDEPDCVLASRWTDAELRVRAPGPVIHPGFHVAAVALRGTALRLVIGGETVHDGHVAPGAVQLTTAGAEARALFHRASDFLHIYLPRRMMPEAETMNARFVVDATTERLARVLLAADAEGVRSRGYRDGIGAAAAASLLDRVGHGPARMPPVGPLPKWRLQRVLAYVEANLGKPLLLADLAAASGLTRMYFAAQFRIATGLRPHDYVLRRRIEHAQDLIATTRTPLAQVALETGFQSQSHFTTRFRQLAGMTPRRWRDANCRSDANGHSS